MSRLRCHQGHEWESSPDGGGAEATCPLCGDGSVTVSLSEDRLARTRITGSDPEGIFAASDTAAAGSRGSPGQPAIPGYEILGELGRGGMGVVYKARRIALNRPVALKMVLSGTLAGAEEIARFLAEAQAVASLQHPNIVQIYEIAEHEGRPYVALEFVDGGNLARRIAQAPLLAVEAADLTESLARAVHYAHEHGILHRDLKPANVLLASASAPEGGSGSRSRDSMSSQLSPGTPKIADFGLAKRLDADSGQTRSGEILGTPSYMAPEQAAGDSRNIGPAADLYALGTILYEMLTGRPPFRAATVLETLEQVRSQEPVSPRRLQPSLPADLETICLKCLRKEPSRRYASAADLADDLARFRNGEAIAARPVSRVERGWRWARRKPLLAGLTVAVVLLALTASIVPTVLAFRLNAARKQSDLSAQAAQKSQREAEESARTAESRRQEAVRQEAIAKTQRDRAERGERLARQHLFGARMNQLQEAVQKRNIARGLELLELTRPGPREEDLRGFEWHHFQRVCTAAQRLVIPIGGPVHSLAYSPDGKVLACGAGTVQLRDVESGKLLAALQGHHSVGTVAYSPDARLLASGSHDGSVVIWDPVTHQKLKTLDGKTGAVRGVAFSPDSKTLAAAVWEGRHVQLWDVATGTIRATLAAPGTGYSVAFSSNGRWLATGAPGAGQVGLWSWDGRTAVPVRAWTVAARSVSVAFSPDSRTLIAGGQKATAFDVESARQLTSFVRFGSDVYAVDVSADGTVALGDQDRNIRLVDREGKLLGVHAHLGPVHAVRFSPDGLELATGGEDGAVRFWDRLSPDEPLPIPSTGGFTAVSPNGRLVVSGGTSETLVLRDPDDGRELARLAGHRAPVRCVEFSPEGTILASGDVHGVTRLWDMSSHRELAALPSDSAGQIWAIAFTRDGGTLAFAWRNPRPDGPHQISLWDVATRKRQNVLSGDFFPVTALAFTADGRLISGHQFGGIKVWDALRGRLLKDLQGNTGGFHSVWSLAVSPDGGMLAASSSTGDIPLWTLPAGTPLKRLTGGTGEVSAVRFLHDGRTLVSASRDGTLRIWDISSGLERATLAKEPAEITALAVSASDRVLVTSGENSLHVWRSDLPPAGSLGIPVRAVRAGRLLQRAQFSRSGRQLDKALADLDLAIRLVPEDPVLWRERGDLHAAANRPEQADRDYTQALSLAPGLGPVWFSRGVVRNTLKRFEDAVLDFEKALALGERGPVDSRWLHGIAHRGAGHVQRDRGDLAGARESYTRSVAVFERLVAEDPQHPWRHHELGWTLLNRGQLLGSQGQTPEAAADFSSAAAAQLRWIEIGRNDAGVRSAYGQHVLHGLPGRQLLDWEPVIRQAVRLWPDDPPCWTGLGRLEYRLGHRPEAKTALLKSLSLQPGGDAVACFHLAMALWMLDEKDQASAAFDRGLDWIRENQPWLSDHKPEAAALTALRAEAARLLSRSE